MQNTNDGKMCSFGWPRAWNAWLAAALAFLPGTSTAQGTWAPDKTVEIVVPTGAGGANDITARTLQSIFQSQRIVNVPINVINKAGGAGSLSLTYLNQQEGNGHYLQQSSINVLTNHISGRSTLHHTDFSQVAMLLNEYVVFVVPADSPLKSGRDMLERLKADPASLSIAIGTAPGGTNHIAAALVAKAGGVDVRRLKTVVFQSNAQSATAIMGKHVDVAPIAAAAALSMTKSGNLRMLGVTSDKRLGGELAGVPTWKEQGVDVDFANSRFMLGPRGMTLAQLAYWDAAFGRLVQSEDWKAAATQQNWASNYLNSKVMPAYMAKLYIQLKGALADAGLIK